MNAQERKQLRRAREDAKRWGDRLAKLNEALCLSQLPPDPESLVATVKQLRKDLFEAEESLRKIRIKYEGPDQSPFYPRHHYVFPVNKG